MTQPDNAAIDELIYHISHDVTAPIRRIGAFVDLLDTQSLEADESEDCLRHLREQSKLAGQMLEGLLALSRIRRDRVNSAPVRVNDTLLALQRNRPDLTVESRIPQDLLISFDAGMFTQLLNCLADNVLAHAPTNQLKITAQATDTGTALDFVQAGDPMCPGHWAQYVRPFATHAGHPAVDAIGMGLTHACRLAEVNGHMLQPLSDQGGFRLSPA